MNLFPCTQCSLCCFHAKEVLADLKALNEDWPLPEGALVFPYKTDEVTGRCEKLTDDGACSVYLNRPMMCNVDRMAEGMGLPKDVFYQMNIQGCNALKEEFVKTNKIPIFVDNPLSNDDQSSSSEVPGPD